MGIEKKFWQALQNAQRPPFRTAFERYENKLKTFTQR